MAAGSWAHYNKAKEYLLDNTLDIDGDTYSVVLAKTTSNAATATLTVYSQITNEIANGNGYVTGGITIGSRTWNTGASVSEMRFDFADVELSASGGAITSIRFAVLKKVGTTTTNSWLMLNVALSTASFDLGSGNKLTIQINAGGAFELN